MILFQPIRGGLGSEPGGGRQEEAEEEEEEEDEIM